MTDKNLTFENVRRNFAARLAKFCLRQNGNRESGLCQKICMWPVLHDVDETMDITLSAVYDPMSVITDDHEIDRSSKVKIMCCSDKQSCGTFNHIGTNFGKASIDSLRNLRNVDLHHREPRHMLWGALDYAWEHVLMQDDNIAYLAFLLKENGFCLRGGQDAKKSTVTSCVNAALRHFYGRRKINNYSVDFAFDADGIWYRHATCEIKAQRPRTVKDLSILHYRSICATYNDENDRPNLGFHELVLFWLCQVFDISHMSSMMYGAANLMVVCNTPPIDGGPDSISCHSAEGRCRPQHSRHTLAAKIRGNAELIPTVVEADKNREDDDDDDDDDGYESGDSNESSVVVVDHGLDMPPLVGNYSGDAVNPDPKVYPTLVKADVKNTQKVINIKLQKNTQSVSLNLNGMTSNEVQINVVFE